MSQVFLKFRYLNWRGDEHLYVVAPESFGVGKTDYDRGELVLNANVITRDGDTRQEMDGRRRSFVIMKMDELEEVRF